MSFSKAVCVLCECPTADGAVLAVHVDKDKLQQWALNVCGHEIAHEIDDRDKICYFCLWQAEFLAQHEFMEESLVWWQGNLELDEAALLLRRKYFEGEVDQCWVQLEKIEMPSDETGGATENLENASAVNQRFKCFYCCRHFKYNPSLWNHIRRKHKNAIRCENHKCSTYFHTLQERNKHNEEVHRKKKTFKCQFCAKEIKRAGDCRRHVRLLHKEFKFACSFSGCLFYFKSDTEMQTHFDSVHNQDFPMKNYQCNDCGYKNRAKYYLKLHIAKMHLPKSIKCETCNKYFPHKPALRIHCKSCHTFSKCAICKQNESGSYFQRNHLTSKRCRRCKEEFACSGLYQQHRGACEPTLLKCENCPKKFLYPVLLRRHKKSSHGNKIKGVQYQSLGFKCDPCRTYYKSEKLLKIHIRLQHNRANWKHCAHCSKSFPNFSLLKKHLSVKHNLIEGTFRCQK